MELFIRRLKRALNKLFSFSLLTIILALSIMFSGVILLNFKRVQAFYYVYAGDKQARQENYDEAIKSYNKALEFFPGHVKARYNLGNIYAAYEDYESALNAYQNTLVYDPEYINARLGSGIILAEEMINLDGAINEYNKAIQINAPFINIPLIYNNKQFIMNAKAIAYYNMGLAYRDKSLLYNPDSLEANDFLARAADSYKQSLKINPKSYDAQYNLALTYHLMGTTQEALEGYCKAMLLAPLNYEAYYNLAVLLRERGQYDLAADEFERAGNLSNFKGDTFKAAFIYDVLNDVSQIAIAQHGFESKKIMDRLNVEIGKDAESIKESEVKAATLAELEKVLLKRLKTCSVCKSYLEIKN